MPVRAKFKSDPIGYFHIDIAEVRTEQGKLYLLVAIDRTSKFVFVELHEKATTRVAADFLRHLIAAVPYKAHTVLTENGIHFTDPKYPGSAFKEVKRAIAAGELFRCHFFALACAQNDVEHRLTKPRHPMTDAQGYQTLIGVNPAVGEVFVDRTRSGPHFHDGFPNRHVAPVTISGGRVRLRVLIDQSIVEVFADDGATVITDRFFRGGGALTASATARGGHATLEMTAWPMLPATATAPGR